MKNIQLKAVRWLATPLLLAVLALQTVPNLKAQTTVNTLGGDGSGNKNGNTLNVALFHNPAGLAVDNLGQNVFMADENNNTIRILELGAGETLGFTDPLISKPVGIALDSQNDIFVLSLGTGKNGTVVEFSSPATGLFFLATNAIGITNAGGITLDPLGNIYVTSSNSIIKINSAGTKTTVAKVTATGADLSGLVYRLNGQLAVCDSGRNGIYNIDPIAGTITTNAGFNGKGDFVTNGFDIDTAAGAKFSQPMGIAEAGDGTLIVADYGNNRCKVLTTTGMVTNLYGISRKYWNSKTAPAEAGWEDGTTTVPDSIIPNVQADEPNGVCIAPDASVYTTEDGFDTFRHVTGAGFGAPPPTVPLAPLNLTASASLGQVTLSWSASSGATNYFIKRSGSSGTEVTISSNTATSFVDTNVLGGNTYYYVVSAVNGGGQSANSAEVSVTVPVPPVPDPQIGFAFFTSTNGSVFVPVSEAGATFNNDADIVIEGNSIATTYYTYGNTAIASNVPDPTVTSHQAPSGYQDGQTPAAVAQLTVATELPTLTIKAISELSGRSNSAVVAALFNFVTANPSINGNNAALFTVSDITTNASLYYTTDGSDPSSNNPTATALGALPLTTNVWIVSLNIQSDTVFKAIAYRNNYQSSAIVTNLFAVANYEPTIVSFGFSTGEASSSFIASPGQTFYAPVTLSLVPGETMYSLQFALTVTNAGPNPGPPVLPGDYNFQSMLMQVIPPATNFPAGVQLFQPIPPFMLATSLSTPLPANETTNYNGEVYLNTDLPDTNLNLLAVGWFERYTQTNLYNTLTQDLIEYSQAHDDTFNQSGSKVIAGGYAFVVPSNALPGQTYQIQVSRASATSDGIGASAGSGGSVTILAPTSGSLSNGAVNSIKNVTLGQFKYLVGDVVPFRWFNAGDFGAGDLVTNGNADAEQVFEAAAYGINAPPAGSDFFDAMDSSGGIGVLDGATGYYTNAGPVTVTQEDAIFGGGLTGMNQIAFGDGQLDVSDVFVTFMRSEDSQLTWFTRFWTNGVRVADTSIANPQLVSKSLTATGTTGTIVQPKVLSTATVAPQVNFAAGDYTNATAGQTLQIPVTADIFGGYPVGAVMLNLSVEPLDGSPALTSPVSFVANAALGNSTYSDAHNNGNFAAAWLPTNKVPALTGNASLGTLYVPVPAGATSLSAYAIHFDHASASPNGVFSFPKQTWTGLITLTPRTNSAYADGIPDSWRLRWFGTTNNVLSVSNACPSGDGMDNWQKYVAGVDPNAANDFPSLNSRTPVPSGSTAAIHWPSVNGVHYVILRSTSLFSGNWTNISTNSGTGVDMEYDDNASGQAKFYRVLIQQP